ncbi:MAG: flap endonuclease [Gemmatimonadota bacterium]|nr:MAG: flap endonuclease [Gemmatimonadota bacterium]
MKVYLVDGTYELFRHYYALPGQVNAAGQEVAATRGVLRSLLALLDGGVTHLAVATDHVIESFRNELWPGYKDGSGIEPELRSQFEPLEEAIAALGIPVWAMVEHEADDGLAAGAALAAADERVEQVLICTPDKDLAQCVEGERVVQFDRRKNLIIDEAGVRERFGVGPESIPDYLALVGDAADGFPGLLGWGAKSAATVLARYGKIENVPPRALDWDVELRAAKRLAATLAEGRELALLFRRLATLDRGAPVSESVDELNWSGPTPALTGVARTLEDDTLVERAAAPAAKREAPAT